MKKMKFPKILVLLVCSGTSFVCVTGAPKSEEPLFELPVELVGFPVIIAAVRISNFVKKLAYSLNPETYRSRTRRDIPLLTTEKTFDIEQIEKKLVKEFGNSICIYERICTKYAELALKNKSKSNKLSWNAVFRQYKMLPEPLKQNYLLSIFLGEIVGSKKLCFELANRNRGCINDIFISK